MHHAADQPGPFTEPRQPLAAADGGRRRGSPVRHRRVGHLHHQAVRLVAQLHGDRGARRVLVRVGEALLDDAVHRVVRGRGERPRIAPAAQLHRRARAPRRRDQRVHPGGAPGGRRPRRLRFGAGSGRGRPLGVHPEDADGLAQLPHRRPGGLPQDAHSLPLPAAELRVHLERPRVHRDQGELVAEAVVHVLGDPLPLQQPRLPCHHRLFAHQLRVVPAQCLQQVTALRAVPGGEPRHDRQHQVGARAQGRRHQQRQLQRVLGPVPEQTARDVQHQPGGVRADRAPGALDATARRPARVHEQRAGAEDRAGQGGRDDEHGGGQRPPDQREQTDEQGHRPALRGGSALHGVHRARDARQHQEQHGLPGDPAPRPGGGGGRPGQRAAGGARGLRCVHPPDPRGLPRGAGILPP